MNLLLCAAALGQAACYLALYCLGNLRNHIPAALGIFLAAFLLYLLSLRLLLKNTCRNSAQTNNFFSRNSALLLMFVLALLYRMILLPGDPTLSDDLYRYIWEGKALGNGFNPFALAPDSAQLAHLRDGALYPRVSRPSLTTIYPPIAQYIFAVASGLSSSAISMKSFFILFDLATVWLLVKTLASLGKNPLQSAIYALNPLIIIEFSGSGHLDSAGIFFMMLALYASLKRKELFSCAALAFAFLVKLMPILLLPLLVRKKASAAALFSAICIAAYLPFVDAGWQLFASLTLYAENWLFNGSVFNLILLIVPDNQQARILAAALLCLIAAGLYYRFTKKVSAVCAEDYFHLSLWLLGLLIIFSPIVHPWYVCWLVPLAAVVGHRAWILFSGLVFAAYWVLRDYAAFGIWKEEPAVLLIQYIPFYGFLLYDFIKSQSIQANASTRDII